jgi:hypothetical protein
MIPVTIGDLYRTWYYRQQTGQNTKFYNVFKELCNDWILIASTQGKAYAIPNSRVPCPNVDQENKICSVYDVCRYVGCAAFPEDWLLNLGVDIYFSDEKIREFECYQGITLEGERREKIKRLRKLIDAETHVTTKLLQSEVPSFSRAGVKPSRRIQRELEEKLRYISGDSYTMRILRENLIRNKILQEYEELVLNGNDPGFSFCGEI